MLGLSAVGHVLSRFLGSPLAMFKLPPRNFLTFVNTTAVAYGPKVGQSLKTFVYAIVVVFINGESLVLTHWLHREFDS